MPQSWQKFCNRVKDISLFDPSDNPYSTQGNPFASPEQAAALGRRPALKASPKQAVSLGCQPAVKASPEQAVSLGRRPAVKRRSHPRQQRVVSSSVSSTNESVIEISWEEIECTVCLEAKHISFFPTRNITTGCTHDIDVCKECLTESIDNQFNDRIWNQIDCPSCGSRLAPEDVNKFGSLDLRGRYNEHCLKALLQSEQHYQLCRHPGCEYGEHVGDSDMTSWLTCAVCKGRTCINCDKIWHTGLSCKQAREAEEDRKRREKQKEEDQASEKRIKEGSKSCPRCKIPGEKVSGCDHMTCPRCKYEYCWICLADYNAIRKGCNNSHLASCKYHGSRIR